MLDSVTNMYLGGWWRRVGATFADNLILLLPYYFVVALFSAIGGGFTGLIVGWMGAGFYYFNMIANAKGQTIGNRVAATRVRDAATGNRITKQQSMIRWVAMTIYGLILVFGSNAALLVYLVIYLADNLYPLFNPRKQTIHDRIAGTIVVLA